VSGGRRRLHNEKLHNICTSPNGTWVMKSRRMRWARHVARTGETNPYKMFVARSEGKRPLGRFRRRWEDNIRMDLSEVGWSVWTGFIWLRIGTSGRML